MVRGEAPRDALVPDPLVNQYPLKLRFAGFSHGPFECGVGWYHLLRVSCIIVLYKCQI